MKDKHFTSRMLICAGALMTVSAILMAICVEIAYGGILLAAAACMFFAARSFRIAEDKKENDTQGAVAEHDRTYQSKRRLWIAASGKGRLSEAIRKENF